MHLLLTPLLYRLLTYKADQQRIRLIGIVLSIIFTTVMVIHMVMDEFLLHATSFGLGVYLLATRALGIIRQIPQPKVRESLRSIALFGVGKSPKAGWL
jgi:dihydroceramidase